jgi:hypothetical protein
MMNFKAKNAFSNNEFDCTDSNVSFNFCTNSVVLQLRLGRHKTTDITTLERKRKVRYEHCFCKEGFEQTSPLDLQAHSPMASFLV